MHLVFWTSMEKNWLAVLKVLFSKCYCLAFMKMLLQRKVLLRKKIQNEYGEILNTWTENLFNELMAIRLCFPISHSQVCKNPMSRIHT